MAAQLSGIRSARVEVVRWPPPAAAISRNVFGLVPRERFATCHSEIARMAITEKRQPAGQDGQVVP
jgi:hypothetical protein